MRIVWIVVAVIAFVSSVSGFSLFYFLIGARTKKK